MLLRYDAKGTDGSDPSQMEAVYSVAGHLIFVPANYTPEQIKSYVTQQYNITANEYDALDALNTTLASLDFTTITSLTDTATTAELVAAIQTLGYVVRELVRQTRFLLKT